MLLSCKRGLIKKVQSLIHLIFRLGLTSNDTGGVPLDKQLYSSLSLPLCNSLYLSRTTTINLSSLGSVEKNIIETS